MHLLVMGTVLFFKRSRCLQKVTDFGKKFSVQKNSLCSIMWHLPFMVVMMLIRGIVQALLLILEKWEMACCPASQAIPYYNDGILLMLLDRLKKEMVKDRANPSYPPSSSTLHFLFSVFPLSCQIFPRNFLTVFIRHSPIS